MNTAQLNLRKPAPLLLPLLLVALALFTGPSRRAYAADNPIVIENQQPGSSGWQLRNWASDAPGQIKGYASATSVNKGTPITFYVTVNPAQTFTIDVYRVGWYQGSGGRLLQQIGPFNGVQQPPCPRDTTTGLIACNWTPTYTLSVPTTWTSGIYLAVLTNAQSYQNDIVFVVRDDNRIAPLLYQQSVTTYQAYNNYPNDGTTGKSLYEYNSYGPATVSGTSRAVKVSFDRPYSEWAGAGQFLQWELYFVRWLEHSGYDVTYSTDLDTHSNGSRLLNYRGFLSVGHDEYWSKQMRDAAEAARDAGVNLAFFGANAAFWQVRFEASANGVANRVMVCYKDGTKDPVQGATTTARWRLAPANRPEQTLIGIQYTSQTQNNGYVSYVVTTSGHWVYAGTGFRDGDSVPGILGYEADRQWSEYPLPSYVAGTYALLSRSPYTNYNGQPDWANSSIYQAPSGAGVFGAGTISWSWGLDNYGSHNIADARIQRTTANILNQFISAAPSGISAPSNLTATAVPAGAVNLTWTDNSVNEDNFVIERSTNQSNWSTITSSWPANNTSYIDTVPSAGVYYYRVKATNRAGASSGYSNTISITTPNDAPPPSVLVFDEGLSSGWADWSYYMTRNFSHPGSPAFSGSIDLQAQATAAWGTIQIHFNNGYFNTSGFSALSFALATSVANQPISIFLNNGSVDLRNVDIRNYSGVVQNGWKFYTIPLSDLAADNTTIQNLNFQDWTGQSSNFPTFWLDKISFAGGSTSNPPSLSIYADGLINGWQNWSWGGSQNFNNSSPVFSGTHSISFVVTGAWGGLYLHNETAINTSSYTTLHFAAQATQSGQKYDVGFYDANNAQIRTVLLSNYGGDPSVGSFRVYSIPLSDLNAVEKLIKGIQFGDRSGASQPALYIDELELR